MLLGKKKQEPMSFADRLSAAKSVFKQAHDEAVVLQTELCGEIEMKEKELNELKKVEKETLQFIGNIAHIVE